MNQTAAVRAFFPLWSSFSSNLPPQILTLSLILSPHCFISASSKYFICAEWNQTRRFWILQTVILTFNPLSQPGYHFPSQNQFVYGGHIISETRNMSMMFYRKLILVKAVMRLESKLVLEQRGMQVLKWGKLKKKIDLFLFKEIKCSEWKCYNKWCNLSFTAFLWVGRCCRNDFLCCQDGVLAVERCDFGRAEKKKQVWLVEIQTICNCVLHAVRAAGRSSRLKSLRCALTYKLKRFDIF